MKSLELNSEDDFRMLQHFVVVTMPIIPARILRKQIFNKHSSNINIALRLLSEFVIFIEWTFLCRTDHKKDMYVVTNITTFGASFNLILRYALLSALTWSSYREMMRNLEYTRSLATNTSFVSSIPRALKPARKFWPNIFSHKLGIIGAVQLTLHHTSHKTIQCSL